MSAAWSVYLVRCADATLYTGITTDVERRVAQHNGEQPGGARYTRSRRPVAVVYREDGLERGAALRREAELKRASRAEKLALVPPSRRRARRAAKS
jgi:putative endonuclease